MTPYHGDTQARLAGGPVAHIIRATVSDAGVTTPIPVTSSSVTFDRGWHPHAQVSIQTTPEAFALADPRAGARLALHAGYVQPSGVEDVHLLADVGIRTNALPRPSADTAITAASDEALVQDARAWIGGSPSTAGVNEHISSVLATVLPGSTLSSVLEPGTLAADVAALEYPVGASLWEHLPSLAVAAGAQLWCGPDRAWRITWPATVAASAAARLTVGEGGVVVESETVISREDSEGWLNWLSVSAAGVTAFAWVGDGPYSVDNAGMKGDHVDLGDEATYMIPSLREYARQALSRRFLRGRQTRVSAPAMYWLRPGHTVTYTPADGTEQRATVARVVFTHPAGLMSVTLQHPETGTIQTGE